MGFEPTTSSLGSWQRGDSPPTGQTRPIPAKSGQTQPYSRVNDGPSHPLPSAQSGQSLPTAANRGKCLVQPKVQPDSDNVSLFFDLTAGCRDGHVDEGLGRPPRRREGPPRPPGRPRRPPGQGEVHEVVRPVQRRR